MSLTSYLAAPSRGVCFCVFVLESIWVLIRFGGALLSHTLRCSTIGATALNFRVREGTGCFACALATKPNKNPKLNSRSEFRRWPEAICRRQIAWPHLSYVTEHVCSASFQYHQRVVQVLVYAFLVFGCLLLDQIKPIGRLVPVN